MRVLLISTVTLVSSVAQPAAKPRCNAHHSGDLWPAHPDACHPLEMCTLDVWKYRWERVTVDVSQLGKDGKRKTGCEDGKPSGAPAKPPAPSH